MSKRAVAVIIAGFLTVFTAFGIRYVYGVLLPEMLPALSISKTQAGIIFSSYFIAYTVFSPILGLLADRADVRLILTLFVVFLGLGAFLMSYASSVVNASLFFTVAGIGHSACWAPVVALIQRWVPDKRRGTALAFTDLGSASGIAVWSTLMPVIVAGYGWRGGWTSLGLSAFIVAAMNFFLVRNHPGEKSEIKEKKTSRVPREPLKVAYQKIFIDSKFWILGFSYLFLGFSIIIPFTFLSTYAAKELMMPYETAARLVAIIAIAGVIGKLLLGHLSDSLGRVIIMMACGALVASGSLGMVFFRGLFSLGLFTAIFGFGYGAIWPVFAAAAQDIFKQKSAGSVVGLWTFFLGVGSTLAPILSGWTIDRSGTSTSAFVLACAGGVVSMLLLLPMVRGPVKRSDGDLHPLQ